MLGMRGGAKLDVTTLSERNDSVCALRKGQLNASAYIQIWQALSSVCLGSYHGFEECVLTYLAQV